MSSREDIKKKDSGFVGEKSLEVLEQEMFSLLNENDIVERTMAFNKAFMKLCMSWSKKARTVRER